MKQQRTTKDGWRLGTYRSYVEPLLGDAKVRIQVLPFSAVTRILIKDKRAFGLEVDRFDETWRFEVKKEVILSAGAVGSPHLLMLSGIGPKEHLTNKGIQTIVDSKGVGQNLQGAAKK